MSLWLGVELEDDIELELIDGTGMLLSRPSQ